MEMHLDDFGMISSTTPADTGTGTQKEGGGMRRSNVRRDPISSGPFLREATLNVRLCFTAPLAFFELVA